MGAHLLVTPPVRLHLGGAVLEGELRGALGGRITLTGRIVPNADVGANFSTRLRIVDTEMRGGLRRVTTVYASVTTDGTQNGVFNLVADDTNDDPYLDVAFATYTDHGQPIRVEVIKFRLLDLFERR